MGGLNIRDRMDRAGPLWKAMRERFEDLINGHNALVGIVLGGQNPHETNDATNVLTLTTSHDIDESIDASQELITQYEAHLADTAVHVGADTTNVVTELGVPMEIYTLLDELKVDYEAHRILTASSVHAGTDAVNVITAANATTKALAILLANDLRTQFIANYANVTSHHGGDGSADAPTVAELVPATATWTQIAELADDLRASHEAHRVNVSGSIHGAADSTNTVTATAVGTVTTAHYAGQNEMKADFNAHIVEAGTSHIVSDISMAVLLADATTLATSLALANGMQTAYTDHISRAAEAAAGPLVATLDEE